MCGGFNYLALNELKRKVPKKGIEKVKSSIIGSKSAVAVGGGGWVGGAARYFQFTNLQNGLHLLFGQNCRKGIIYLKYNYFA